MNMEHHEIVEIIESKLGIGRKYSWSFDDIKNRIEINEKISIELKDDKDHLNRALDWAIWWIENRAN